MLRLVVSSDDAQAAPKKSPELGALIECVRFLHEHELTAFYCLARMVKKTAENRNGPERELVKLRKFIEEWD